MSIKTSFKTTEKDKGYKKLMETIENMKGGPYLKVGIQAEDGGDEVEGSDFNLAALGSVLEFGTSSAGPNNDTVIPARSHIRSTMEENKSYFLEVTRGVLTNISMGKDILKEMNRLGLVIAERIKAKINSNIPPANAPSTIRAKGSSRTLIDTGRYRNSIRHKLVMSGDEE